MDSDVRFLASLFHSRNNKEPRHLNGASGLSVSVSPDSLVIWNTENPES
jgi:hypothetical protein